MRKVIAFIAVVLWICFIFYNSSNINEISQKRSLQVVHMLNKDLKPSNKAGATKIEAKKKEHRLNYIIRKNAHAFEYLVLAVLLYMQFSTYKMKLRTSFKYILFICVLTACADEYYQSFIDGRTSSALDVLIDTGGSLLGLMLVKLCGVMKSVTRDNNYHQIFTRKN
jgi:VanZ family protein